MTTENTPEVSVIILNWNGEKLMRRFLPSIMKTMPACARLIVADNGSTDGSIAYLESDECHGVEVMKFPVNYGFAEGYNRAINAIDTPYAILLNSDVEADSDWVTPLLDYMIANPLAGACQPKLLSVNSKKEFEYAGACGGYLDKYGYPYCRGRIFDCVERDNGQYDDTAEVFWASGAALMVRTQVYKRAGGLDAKFFAHMEEIDLCWRIRLLGYSIAVVPESHVYHLGGGSLPADNPRKTYLNFRNNLLMLHRNLPDSVRGRILFVRRLLDAVAWLKFMCSFDFANASAIIGAHRDFRRMRREYTIHPSRNILTAEPNKRLSIVWQHYLRGVKKYSDLPKEP